MSLAPPTLVLGWDWNGCTLWRGAFPVVAARYHGEPAEWARVEPGVDISAPEIESRVQDAEIIVLIRAFFWLQYAAGRDAWFGRRRAAGQTVLWDIDDDLLTEHYAPHMQASYPEVDDGTLGDRLAAQHAMLDWVDGIIVTTPTLAATVRWYTDKPIEVVPNRLAWDWWREVWQATPRQVPAPCIGWAGGNRTAADFAPMVAAWARIHRRYPAVHFQVAGWCPPGIQAVIAANRLHVRPWVSAERSPSQWRDVDIACLPLADNGFTRCKSALKAYEAAAAGAAIVASPTIYADVLTPGRTGLLAETAADWEAALAGLLDGRKERQRMARRWQAEVRARYTLETDWAAWPRAWAALRAVTRRAPTAPRALVGAVRCAGS